jgi:acetyltransferase-like isoleucine patch superfamily enzyme
METMSKTESGVLGEPGRRLGSPLPVAQNVTHKPMRENPFRGFINRILQPLAMFAPGGLSVRVLLQRARGVHIGKDVFISYNVVLETGFPHLITIEDGAFIGIGAIVIAHFQDHLTEPDRGIKIGKRAFIGPGVIILPDVEIGDGAVVTAGSVVTRSVPAMTMVQGNPAVPIARCGVPLWPDTPLKEFSSRLIPIPPKKTWRDAQAAREDEDSEK